MQGEVIIDGYGVPLPQPNARRLPPDHEEDHVPQDCLEYGTDECVIGHPCLILNDKDLVDLGERAGRLSKALRAVQFGTYMLHILQTSDI